MYVILAHRIIIVKEKREALLLRASAFLQRRSTSLNSQIMNRQSQPILYMVRELYCKFSDIAIELKNMQYSL